ncbi:MAG: reverse transcriptase family protein [Candidatus Thiodiazotropha sp.]
MSGISIVHGETPDFVWVQLKKSFFHLEDDIYIGFIYLSPINSTVNNSKECQSFECLETDVCKFKSKGKVILLGDLNSRTSRLSDFIVNDDDKHTPVPDIYISDDKEALLPRQNEDISSPNTYGKRLLDFCKDLELRILNGRIMGDLRGKLTCYKWNGCSTVDYGIVQKELVRYVDFFKVHELVGHISDHCPISFGLKCKYDTFTDTCKIHQLDPNFKWDNKSEFLYKMNLISDETRKQIDTFLRIGDTEDIESMTTDVTDILISAAQSVLRQNKHKNGNNLARRRKKWFDQDCFNLRKEVVKLGRKICKTNSTHEQRLVFFKKRKELKKTVKLKKKIFKQNILDQLNDVSERNPKEYWRLVRDLKELENQSSKTNSPISPEEWIRHFSELLCSKNRENSSEMEKVINEMSSNAYFTNLDYRITKKEIYAAVKNLNNGKACGLDRISAEMIKASLPSLLDVYEKLFNSIFRNGLYPNCWRENFIVPIFKSGSRADPTNYRGIAINSVLGKVFSIILKNRLESFVRDNNLIDDTQIGFKSNCRTSDHMFILKTLIDKYIKKLKAPLYVCFVDFKKAYDSVWRQALMYKLLMQNVQGMFFNILRSMYLDNNICIKINNKQRSNFFKSNVGVRQGDALSPILFNLFTSDLHDFLNIDCQSPLLDKTNVNCLMYADDLLLLSESEIGLQRLLDRVNDYCGRWGMEVNIEKTKVIKFSGNGHRCKTVFMYNGSPVENVLKYKYLGIEFSSSGSWTAAISNLSNRGMKALFLLKRYICSGNINPRLALKLFDQMIKPILCYGSEIWSVFDSNKRNFRHSDGIAKFLENLDIEKVHTRFCKFILGVNKRAVNLAVKGELGRFPIGISCWLQVLRYWDHLQNTENTLLREAFALNEYLHTQGVNTWFSFIDNLCKLNGLKPLHLLKDSLSLLRNNLCELFVEYWSKGIKSYSKMDTYTSFKDRFCMENYLNTVSNRAHRVSYTKIRISNHRLAVETGRYHKIPRCARFCEYCKTQEVYQVEDEKHVLLSCLKYNNFRNELFDIIRENCRNFDILPDDDKFTYLLNSDGPTVRAVARFFHQIQNA